MTTKNPETLLSSSHQLSRCLWFCEFVPFTPVWESVWSTMTMCEHKKWLSFWAGCRSTISTTPFVTVWRKRGPYHRKQMEDSQSLKLRCGCFTFCSHRSTVKMQTVLCHGVYWWRWNTLYVWIDKWSTNARYFDGYVCRGNVHMWHASGGGGGVGWGDCIWHILSVETHVYLDHDFLWTDQSTCWAYFFFLFFYYQYRIVCWLVEHDQWLIPYRNLFVSNDINF